MTIHSRVYCGNKELKDIQARVICLTVYHNWFREGKVVATGLGALVIALHVCRLVHKNYTNEET